MKDRSTQTAADSKLRHADTVTVRILEGITNLELGQASAFSMVVIVLVYLAVVLASLAMRKLNAGSLGQAGSLLGG